MTCPKLQYTTTASRISVYIQNDIKLPSINFPIYVWNDVKLRSTISPIGRPEQH